MSEDADPIAEAKRFPAIMVTKRPVRSSIADERGTSVGSESAG